MSLNPFPSMRRGWRFCWRTLDATRRLVLNLLFLFIVIGLMYAIFGSSGLKPLAARTTLVLDLKGHLVEQHSGGAREALLSSARGDGRKSVQLRDVLTVLDAAGQDAAISGVLVLLDDLQGGGLAQLREVAAGI